MSEQRKAVIKNADMSEAMQQDAVDISSVALSKYNIEKARTAFLLKGILSFESGPHKLVPVSLFCHNRMSRLTSRRSLTRSTTQRGKSSPVSLLGQSVAHVQGASNMTLLSFRHVIVGRNFGSYVTHETKHFIYFYLGQVAILLFKSG